MDTNSRGEKQMAQRVKRRGDDLARRLTGFAARIGQVVDALLETRLSPLLDENDELIAIFVKSITTAKGQKPVS